MAVDDDRGKTVRRLRGDVSRLEHDLERLRTQVVVFPILAVTILMLFWPTFDAAGREGVVDYDVEYAADDGPVTLTGLWRAASDRDLTLLGWLAIATVVLHLAVIVCLILLTDADSKGIALGTQIVGGLYGAAYLVVLIGVSQDDGDGAFGQEGYQPSGAWILMAATVLAVIGVAQWVRDGRR